MTEQPSIAKIAWYIAFLQAVVATTGSLFFSQIMNLTPCVLCWYQRICMYPLVIILAIGIVKKDKWLPYYVLPLAGIGAAIGLYHNLLYYHILPESIAPCTAGVSCTTRLIEWFGFITIPLLSLTAFLVIIVCAIIAVRNRSKAELFPLYNKSGVSEETAAKVSNDSTINQQRQTQAKRNTQQQSVRNRKGKR